MQYMQKKVLLDAGSFLQEQGCIELTSKVLRLQIGVDVVSPVEIGVNSDL